MNHPEPIFVDAPHESAVESFLVAWWDHNVMMRANQRVDVPSNLVVGSRSKHGAGGVIVIPFVNSDPSEPWLRADLLRRSVMRALDVPW